MSAQTASERKYEELKAYLASLGSVAIAFSGGVDSAFLMYAAKDALGDKTIAITAVARSFPERELTEAKEFCAAHNIRHFLSRTDELEIEGFRQNPRNRCYICKRELFSKMIAIAKEQGMAEVAEGSNLDDNGDYRPGLQAIAELGVKSPLRSCGFTKADIRELSRKFGLPTWNKQSFACLASRFPYGDEITAEKLTMVDKAEQLLLDMGLKQLRVRVHDNIARIELLPEDFPVVMEEKTRVRIYEEFRHFGFSYVTLDLMGYRTGSMNETLSRQELASGQHL